MSKLALFGEVVAFLRERGKLWLLPLIVLLLLVGLIIAFAETSVLGPFLYPLF